MQVSGSGELLHDICSVNNNLSGVRFRYTAGVVQEPPSVGSSTWWGWIFGDPRIELEPPSVGSSTWWGWIFGDPRIELELLLNREWCSGNAVQDAAMGQKRVEAGAVSPSLGGPYAR
jgi:hypothetical protein